MWLPNNRGTFYSSENLLMNPNVPTSGYWNFSWDDIALDDFPDVFEYVRKITNQPKFYVIGHSQGTSLIMALLSERPEFNRQINAVSLLAPIGYVDNSVMLKILAARILRENPVSFYSIVLQY